MKAPRKSAYDGTRAAGTNKNAPYARGEQARNHRLLVPNPVNNLGGREGKNEIRSKKRKLNELGLLVIQVKNRFQMGHQNVIQAGKKSPHKKQRGHRSQRSAVALPRAGRRGCSSSRSVWGRNRHECNIRLLELILERGHHSIARVRFYAIFLHAA